MEKRPREIGFLPSKIKMTQAILYKRIRQAGEGQFGKTKSVGGCVFEMKIDYGPGFRIYYGIHSDEIILIFNRRKQAGNAGNR